MSKKPNHDVHIFYADSRFERMARRPGAKTREQALEHAGAQVEELKPSFEGLLDRQLQELNALLSQVERNSDGTSALDRALSSCSQLRDVGTTMGFEMITFVAVRGGGIVGHWSGGDLRPRRSKIQPVVRLSFVFRAKGSRRDVCRGGLRGGSAICFQ